MKNLVALFAFAVVACALPGIVNADENEHDAPKILVIEGAGSGKEQKMSEDDIALITPEGIAGSQITIKVAGPAKAKLYDVVPAIIGPANKKALVQPTGKGKVKVSITVKFPTGDPPKTYDYKFEVK